ncbi:MAG TPA: hypothetical protein VKU86_01790, partial [Acidimicrobiales bacterium]|nr:hypothetical protein [Acidimicrobiales bacterium]
VPDGGGRTPRHARGAGGAGERAAPSAGTGTSSAGDVIPKEDPAPDASASVVPSNELADDAGTSEEFDTGRRSWTPPTRGRGAYRPGTVPTRLAVLLGAVAIAASALAVVFGILWSTAGSGDAQASQAKQVAQLFLLKFTNFKPSTIQSDFRALQSFATGNFAQQAAHNFGNVGLRQQLVQAQVQSKGTIEHIYVQSLNGDKAQVFAVVNQSYTNAQQIQAGNPMLQDVLRLEIDLAQVSGAWKISDVLVLSGPTSATTPTG